MTTNYLEAIHPPPRKGQVRVFRNKDGCSYWSFTHYNPYHNKIFNNYEWFLADYTEVQK